MKKVVVSLLAVVSIILTSGCSGVSQEEYNSLVEENSKLQSDYESIKSEKDKLVNDIDTLQSEKDELQKTLDQENSQSNELYYCFDIETWMLGRPQSAVKQNEVSKYDDDVDLETTYYMEGSQFTVKVVHTIKDTLSPTLTAIHILSYEKAAADKIGNLLDDELKEYVIIYRNYNDGKGNVIMSSFWYLDEEDGELHHKMFSTLYGQKQGIVDEFQKIAG